MDISQPILYTGEGTGMQASDITRFQFGHGIFNSLKVVDGQAAAASPWQSRSPSTDICTKRVEPYP